MNRKYTKLFINEHNRKLWNDCICTEQIKIKIGNYPNYAVDSQYKIHTIYVQENLIHIPAFTHELLHIYLGKIGIYIGGSLKILSLSSDKLQRVLTQDLIDSIGNNLEHIKMLPMFLNMGFNRRDFISDFDCDRGSPEIFRIIQFTFNSGSYTGVSNFIGNYFAMKACPNDKNDYSHSFRALENLNPELFQIIEEFYHGWVKYDISDPYQSYRDYAITFIQNLNDWLSERNLV